MQFTFMGMKSTFYPYIPQKKHHIGDVRLTLETITNFLTGCYVGPHYVVSTLEDNQIVNLSYPIDSYIKTTFSKNVEKKDKIQYIETIRMDGFYHFGLLDYLTLGIPLAISIIDQRIRLALDKSGREPLINIIFIPIYILYYINIALTIAKNVIALAIAIPITLNLTIVRASLFAINHPTNESIKELIYNCKETYSIPTI